MIKKIKKTEDQIDRFREMARELGADENEEAFKAKLRVIARQKPKTEHKGTHGGNTAPQSGERGDV